MTALRYFKAIKVYALLFLMSSFSAFRRKAVKLEGQGKINSNLSTSAAPPTLLKGDVAQMRKDHCNWVWLNCNYSYFVRLIVGKEQFWAMSLHFLVSPKEFSDTWIRISEFRRFDNMFGSLKGKNMLLFSNVIFILKKYCRFVSECLVIVCQWSNRIKFEEMIFSITLYL